MPEHSPRPRSWGEGAPHSAAPQGERGEAAAPAVKPAASWRMFFALDPSAALRLRIAEHARLWRWNNQTRPVQQHKLHLTLLFMPAVDPARVPDLLRLGAAAASAHPGCLLWLDRALVWPGGIAHLAPGSVPASLQALHAALLRGAQAAGIGCDQRAWHPHLTLARRADPAQAPGHFDALRWQVRGFSLQRSVLGSGRYETLGRWRMGTHD